MSPNTLVITNYPVIIANYTVITTNYPGIHHQCYHLTHSAGTLAVGTTDQARGSVSLELRRTRCRIRLLRRFSLISVQFSVVSVISESSLISVLSQSLISLLLISLSLLKLLMSIHEGGRSSAFELRNFVRIKSPGKHVSSVGWEDGGGWERRGGRKSYD